MASDILVITEYAENGFRKSTYEVISEGRRLADKLNTSLCAVVLGSGVLSAASELKHYGADRVLVCDAPELADFDSDRFTPILFDIAKNRRPKIILFAASIRDRQLAARLAAKLDAGLAMECTGLALEGEKLIATRSMYGSKLIAKVAILDTLRNGKGSEKIADLSKDMKAEMFDGVGIFRTGEGMKEALENVRVLRQRFRDVRVDDKGKVFNTDLLNAWELGNLLDLGRSWQPAP